MHSQRAAASLISGYKYFDAISIEYTNSRPVNAWSENLLSTAYEKSDATLLFSLSRVEFFEFLLRR
jgi:hypothetical protein